MKKTFTLNSAFYALLFCLVLSSCSKDKNEVDPSKLIKKYELAGNYQFTVSPMLFGQTVLATGTIDGTIKEEEKGVLRMRFSGFKADPMPFKMNMDVQFTVAENSKGLSVSSVREKGFFNAVRPEDGVEIDSTDIPGGLELTEEELNQGLHSNGKSILKGAYDSSTEFNLELDPVIGLPMTIRIKAKKI